MHNICFRKGNICGSLLSPLIKANKSNFVLHSTLNLFLLTALAFYYAPTTTAANTHQPRVWKKYVGGNLVERRRGKNWTGSDKSDKRSEVPFSIQGSLFKALYLQSKVRGFLYNDESMHYPADCANFTHL